MTRSLIAFGLLTLLAGCTGGDDYVPETLYGGPLPDGAIVVTHGGVGSPPQWNDHTGNAAEAGRRAMIRGGSALDAAVAGTVAMEDIPILNAGTGANIRLDGRTIQMDAAVMTSDGEFAAVAVIENVRNPVRVARAVLDTPHRLLAGDGATRFAHAMGFADEVPVCPEAEQKYRKRYARLLAGEAGGGYDDFDWRRAWNFPGPIPPEPEGPEREEHVKGDTVGTVVRHADGSFAVALSTGGTSITLDGRVGDVPIYGCGTFAGPAGAVACTGHGEEIIRQAMARKVYRSMEDGLGALEAVRVGCRDFPVEWSLGLIAVGRDGWGVAANREMAHGVAGE